MLFWFVDFCPNSSPGPSGHPPPRGRGLAFALQLDPRPDLFKHLPGEPVLPEHSRDGFLDLQTHPVRMWMQIK